MIQEGKAMHEKVRKHTSVFFFFLNSQQNGNKKGKKNLSYEGQNYFFKPSCEYLIVISSLSIYWALRQNQVWLREFEGFTAS